MASKLWLPILVIAILGGIIVLVLKRPKQREIVSSPTTSETVSEIAVPAPSGLTPGLGPLERSLLLQFGKSKNTSVHDLTILSQIWQTYSRQIESLPHGNERDWSRALLGSNRLNSAFFPANHPNINQNQQICDSWGTPLRYHILSRNHIEVISAGADTKFFTADDIKSKNHRK